MKSPVPVGAKTTIETKLAVTLAFAVPNVKVDGLLVVDEREPPPEVVTVHEEKA
jgi:hypothetical protein